MKKKIAILLLLVFAFTALFTLTSCGINDLLDKLKPDSGDNQQPDQPQPLTCKTLCDVCGKCTDNFCLHADHADKCMCASTADGKHLLVDMDGNYGGDYAKALYGSGAPLNGKYDVANDIYYTQNDYYALKCTDTRTILPRFSPYQQTMAKTDGLACMLMVLNYFGEDVTEEFTETQLMMRYEELNGTNVSSATNGTTVKGLVELFNDIGYLADGNPFIPSSTGSSVKAVEFTDYLITEMELGNIVMVRFQDGINFRWHVVIGVDTMGENLTYLVRDNVFIFADPCDDSDHYQDGYSISSASRFATWWLKQGSTTTSNAMECISVHAPKAFNLAKDNANDLVDSGVNQAPERHLLLNADGSFGGSLNINLYGTVEEKNGFIDTTVAGLEYDGLGGIEHTTYTYFAYPDYYNMKPSASRYILENYKAFQQTEASSCGICSIFSVLNYYNYDFSQIHNNKDIKQRASLFASGKKPTSNSGNVTYQYWNSSKTSTFNQIDANDNGRKQEALTLIYMANDSAFDSGTKLFNNYGGVGASKLKNVPKSLGYSGIHYYSSSKYHGVFPTYSDFSKWVIGNLNKKQPMCTGWCPVSGHWTTIIGYDNMGTDFIYDDVIIIADSHDVSDHYQDGYNTYPASMFWAQWRNGGGGTFEQYVFVDNPHN